MSSSFNLNLAIECAEAIRAVYSRALKPTINEPGTDTQVRIEEAHAGEFFIIFPGTASFRDWRTDAKILKTDWDGEGAMVHRGFAQALESVAHQIGEQIRPAKSLVITGHSLGGALATLLADQLADLDIVTAVYTFGSPRVGNRTFARCYSEALHHRTFRIVNARDPVPWLPFPLPVPRSGIYTHVAGQIYLPHDGGIEIEPVLPHVADAVATVRDQAQEQKFFGDVLTARTHQITSYLTKLKQLA